MINTSRMLRERRRIIRKHIWYPRSYPESTERILDTLSRNFSASELRKVASVKFFGILVTRRLEDRTEGYGRSKSQTSLGDGYIAMEFHPDCTEDTITHEFTHALRLCREINPATYPRFGLGRMNNDAYKALPDDMRKAVYLKEETLTILEACARTRYDTPEWDIPSGYNELNGYASYLKDRALVKGIGVFGDDLAQKVLDAYPQSEASRITLEDDPNKLAGSKD